MSNYKVGDREQIYTPKKLTDFLINKCLKPFVDEKDITEILEPSAGDGMMLDVIKEHYPNIPTIQYDIEPFRVDIIKMNFLDKKQNKIEYKKGRVTIMNPPFTFGIKFIKKCLELSDYVCCITAQGTFINLDYDAIYLEELYYVKKVEFADGKKYSINMMLLKNKDDDNV